MIAGNGRRRVGLKRALKRYRITQDAVAAALGRDRTLVCNTLNGRENNPRVLETCRTMIATAKART